MRVVNIFRGRHPEVFFYRRTPMPKCVSIKLLCNFIEITLWYGWSPVNLLHIFRTPLTKNTSGWMLLYFQSSRKKNASKKKNGNGRKTTKLKTTIKRQTKIYFLGVMMKFSYYLWLPQTLNHNVNKRGWTGSPKDLNMNKYLS